jgi:hypothetical protein
LLALEILLEAILLELISLRRVFCPSEHEIYTKLYLFLVYFSIKLYMILILILQQHNAIRSKSITELDGSLQLRKTISFFGEQF